MLPIVDLPDCDEPPMPLGQHWMPRKTILINSATSAGENVLSIFPIEWILNRLRALIPARKFTTLYGKSAKCKYNYIL